MDGVNFSLNSAQTTPTTTIRILTNNQLHQSSAISNNQSQLISIESSNNKKLSNKKSNTKLTNNDKYFDLTDFNNNNECKSWSKSVKTNKKSKSLLINNNDNASNNKQILSSGDKKNIIVTKMKRETANGVTKVIFYTLISFYYL